MKIQKLSPINGINVYQLTCTWKEYDDVISGTVELPLLENDVNYVLVSEVYENNEPLPEKFSKRFVDFHIGGHKTIVSSAVDGYLFSEDITKSDLLRTLCCETFFAHLDRQLEFSFEGLTVEEVPGRDYFSVEANEDLGVEKIFVPNEISAICEAMDLLSLKESFEIFREKAKIIFSESPRVLRMVKELRQEVKNAKLSFKKISVEEKVS